MGISLANVEQIESIRSSGIYPSKCCFLIASGRLTMAHSEDIHTVLVKTIKKHDDILLDLSFVSEMDFFGLQLLLALKKTCNAQSKSLFFHDPNLLVCDLINFMHLEEEISEKGTGRYDLE